MPKYSGKSQGLQRLLKKYDDNIVKAIIDSIVIRLFRRKQFRTVFRVFSRPKEPKRWIFVVGCYNSGTKLLTSMLGAHPSIATMPHEGRFLTDGLPDLQQGGWRRMLFKNQHLWNMPDDVATSVNLKRMIVKDWSPLFNSSKTRTIFLDKSICHSVRVSWLNAYFEENGIKPFFIHLARDGNVVASSVQKTGSPIDAAAKEVDGRYPIELCAQQWVALNEAILSDVANFDNYALVRFEDLVREPQKVLDIVFDKAGLSKLDTEYRDGVLKIGGVNFEVRTDLNNVHLKRFEGKKHNMVKEITRDTMLRLGYRQ